MKALISRLHELDRYRITVLLASISIFSFILTIVRALVEETRGYLFLNWNLFLAFIPWLLSSVILVRRMNKPIHLVLLIGAWLLFFPNSPYILTDLIHLNSRGAAAPIWFDLIVILSFAWAGLLYGFISLMDIEHFLSKYVSKKRVFLFPVFFLFLASFGIYLGRYLRWNSWDILRDPLGLGSDILERFAHPADHLRTWGTTVLLGLLLNFMYFSFKMFRSKPVVALT